MHKATIGSISHGTMRPIDLVDSFVDELRRLVKSDAYDTLIAECDTWLESGDDENEPDDETGNELVEELFDALNDQAPDYCYFGANEGDGSDYGFWPCIDQMENDVRSGELLKVNDLSEIPAGYSGQVMHVNDHGNVTLYAPKIEYVEVWGCV